MTDPKTSPDAAAPTPDGGATMPPIDFTTFILSLSSTALMNLGVVKAPGEVAHEPSLPMAQQTIDLLALLHEKTRGNLTGEEERLLDQVLHDLRMRFVALAGQKK